MQRQQAKLTENRKLWDGFTIPR